MDKNKIKEYITDENAIKVGSSELLWLWIVKELQIKKLLQLIY